MQKMNYSNYAWIGPLVGGIFIAYGLLVFFVIFLPYQKSGSFESSLIDVVDVRTSIYQKNASQDYPIGALEFGEQRILLLNKSNETIDAFFILKVKNMSGINLVVNVKSEGKEYLIFTLAELSKEELKIPFGLSAHGMVFIDVNVSPVLPSSQELTPFPVSVTGWSFQKK